MALPPLDSMSVIGRFMSKASAMTDYNQSLDGSIGQADYSTAALRAILERPHNPHDGILPTEAMTYMRTAYDVDLDGEDLKPMDLSILSTDTHDDSQMVNQDQFQVGARTNGQTHLGFLLDEDAIDEEHVTKSKSRGKGRSRRKARSSSKESEDEVLSRKQRGRPRLDARDATAADRRRTQIRLAQRAYRLRKETTISSLKKRVDALEGTIDEMSRSFLRFNESAMASGIMQLKPEFAQDSREMTQHFLSLAKVADLKIDHEDENSGDASMQDRESTEAEVLTSPRRPQIDCSTGTSSSEIQQLPILGYQVSSEEFEDIRTSSDHAPCSPARQEPGTTALAKVQSPKSFINSFDSIQQNHVQVPEPLNFNGSMNSTLGVPYTYSFHETSFARRLQRASLEQSFRQISDPSTPPSFINQKFALTLLFRTKEQIIAKIGKTLKKSRKESLEHDPVPYIHLGGAGTHYPRIGENGNPIPVPNGWTVKSIGPQNLALIEGTRVKGVTPEMLIDIAGLEGEWFDAWDVEQYLREKGLHLDGQSSFAELEMEIPPAVVTASQSPMSSNEGTSNGPMSPLDVASPLNLSQQNEFFAEDLTTGFGAFEDFNNASFDAYGNFLFKDSSNKNTEDTFGFGTQGITATSIPRMLDGGATSSLTCTKRTVTVDVSHLLEEIIRGGRCLGRASGFRRKDVDAALTMAMQVY
ncbi:MAG: hypothetical protein M1827_006174 [Pycnora praestabilis]|nr:MAG: hypothetical protein M1827_006174 [Pycnora praestabilis]